MGWHQILPRLTLHARLSLSHTEAVWTVTWCVLVLSRCLSILCMLEGPSPPLAYASAKPSCDQHESFTVSFVLYSEWEVVCVCVRAQEYCYFGKSVVCRSSFCKLSCSDHLPIFLWVEYNCKWRQYWRVLFILTWKWAFDSKLSIILLWIHMLLPAELLVASVSRICFLTGYPCTHEFISHIQRDKFGFSFSDLFKYI